MTEAEAIAAILAHPNSLPADRDVAFLNRNDTRGIRLQLDYQKAEILLEGHGVAHTVVVFGSTRLRPAEEARAALAAAEAALAEAPEDASLRRAVAVAARRVANARYYDIARAFGALVGAAGARAHGGRLLVMTGGGPGIMAAANRGAHEAGERSIGLNITLPHEQHPNPWISPELCFSFHYFAIRKLHFLLRARALVVFPGGYGTLDELFEVLTLIQTRKMAPLPVVMVGEEYWRRIWHPEVLVAEGSIDPEDLALIRYAETAEAIWRHILDWYETRGTPLLHPEASP
ncbi:MAG: TIGR00730 family Rossman fold protein [Acetobacteraceae bacterium]